MPSSGLFITLNDKETLNLYLDKGVYGELRPPEFGEVAPVSQHYGGLADAACAREGTHVFFFSKRKIAYGGQIIGTKNYGSYYLNGPYSPMGRKSGANIYWDESSRRCYKKTEKPGIFERHTPTEVEVRCQPYFLKFKDDIGLRGKCIESDVLYTRLSFLHHPLQSNSIQRMSFCTLTPYETDLLLELLRDSSENIFERPIDDIKIEGDPILFDPSFGISNLSESTSKRHFDALILSNPYLLPFELRPDGATICRKIPITPFKPSQMDRADICYYTEEQIGKGTIPNKVIEQDIRMTQY